MLVIERREMTTAREHNHWAAYAVNTCVGLPKKTKNDDRMNLACRLCMSYARTYIGASGREFPNIRKIPGFWACQPTKKISRGAFAVVVKMAKLLLAKNFSRS
jgi:hypothetical protein